MNAWTDGGTDIQMEGISIIVPCHPIQHGTSMGSTHGTNPIDSQKAFSSVILMYSTYNEPFSNWQLAAEKRRETASSNANWDFDHIIS